MINNNIKQNEKVNLVMSKYVAVKFITGQEVLAELIDNNDDETTSLKRLYHVIPDPNDPEGKSMILSPFNPMVDPEKEIPYKNEHIMSIQEPFSTLTNMMTKKFSAIIQPSAEASNVAKLIL